MTAPALFSGAWALIPDAALSDRLRGARDELARALAPGEVVVRLFNENYLAMCGEVAIDLPARGPVGGVDIRETEPVALLFHRRDYPNRAPLARSDRRDFPVAQLPHLTRPPAISQRRSVCIEEVSTIGPLSTAWTTTLNASAPVP